MTSVTTVEPALERTAKEEEIDRIYNNLGGFSDDLFVALKKLTIAHLTELRKTIEEVE